MKTLFFYQNHDIAMGFGIKPAFDQDVAIYDSLSKVLSIKQDLHWHERRDVQRIIASANFWNDFPFDNCQLIASEVFLEEYRQRIDLLYLTNAGRIQICELKLGGAEKDTIGQLLRYIGELSEMELSVDWVRSKAAKYKSVELDSFEYKFDRHCRKLDEFIKNNNIHDVELDSMTASLIDENPDSRVILAARQLNKTGYSIRIYNMEMLTSQAWTFASAEQYIKMNISQIEI